MSRICQFFLIFLIGIVAGCGRIAAPVKPPAPGPVVSKEKPVDLRAQKEPEERAQKEAKELDDAIAPQVKKAQETFPEAKKKYLQGLDPGCSFVIRARLKDDSGASEHVFIRVSDIEGGKVTGKIESQVLVVKGFKTGDEHSVPEVEVLDWLINHADGSQDGNVVGKFIENWQNTRASK